MTRPCHSLNNINIYSVYKKTHAAQTQPVLWIAEELAMLLPQSEKDVSPISKEG